MAEQWTRDELEALCPYGTVNVQVDDEVRPMTQDEWDAWIESAVGTEKPVSAEAEAWWAAANGVTGEIEPIDIMEVE